MSKTALVCEDTPANLDFLTRLMTSAGFEVLSATDGKSALSTTEKLDDLKLALIDMELPDISGIQLTSMFRAKFPKAIIIVATMHDDHSLIQSVFNKGGNVFLVKPHGFMELFKRLTTNDLNTLREAPPTVIDQYGPRTYGFAGA